MRRLPLFPLPMVLLPGATLPLHVFEPRYRQMMAHCLEGDRRFGLVYHNADLFGAFQMEGQIGCVAELLQFQPLPDGRSLVLCRGEERFYVEDGIESASLYWEALAGEYWDVGEDGGDLVDRRRASFELLLRALATFAGAPASVPIDLDRETAFQIAALIQATPEWQQQLLIQRRERSRLDQIDDLLMQLIDRDPTL